jgi:EmrB/QacA subfamily drug resistance transporter
MKSLQTHRYRWIGFAFVAISLLVASMNDTILNVSLPVISKDLHSTTSELQWVADGYMLVFASLLLTMGGLSDRFGRKKFLIFGVFIFSVFSIVAANSVSTKMLIVAHALQAVGGAIILPSTLSLITSLFSDPNEQTKGIALWSAMFGLGVGIGPVLGGWLLNIPGFTWHVVFWVSIPFAVIAMIGTILFVPESKDTTSPKTDVPGVILSSIGLFALVFAVIEIGAVGHFSFPIIAGLGIFIVALIVFLLWERHTDQPMLPLYLFKNRSFSVANIAMTIALFGLLGLEFYLPQYFQGVQGYSPLETGIRLLPAAVISVCTSIISPRMVKRFGIKKSVAGGFTLATIGLMLMIIFLRSTTPYLLILMCMFIIFSGIDTAMPATTMSIMGAVPYDKAGVGSAMNEMTGQIGGALGIAVIGSILNKTYLSQVSSLAMKIPAETYQEVQKGLFTAHQAASGLTFDAREAVAVVANQAFLSGFKEALIVCVSVFAVIAIFTALFLPDQAKRTELNMDEF